MARRQVQEKREVAPIEPSSGAVEYVGKRTKTGNSTGFRFESALFRSHPEFSGTVRARVIAPGRLLVEADPVEMVEGNDPVLGPFLALIAKDMTENPHKITALDEERMRKLTALVAGVDADTDEDLGDEDLLS